MNGRNTTVLYFQIMLIAWGVGALVYLVISADVGHWIAVGGTGLFLLQYTAMSYHRAVQHLRHKRQK